ncbi:hypothetical protein [Streptomyces sp. NPDC058964]|uniref:hypothetical protein n=1 Tax=Streptomyces sp. NPDC058964 TaxID=3346681 RepID=UPI0036AF561C
MSSRTVRASTVVVALASFLLSCSGSPKEPADGGKSPAHGVGKAVSAPGSSEPAAASTASRTAPAPAVEKVRDVFARLQATYNDGCTTPANCEYFLGRVLDELNSLELSMKTDPQGPAHFKEPLARIAALHTELGDDRSFANLKKHQDQLTGARDKINAWMQGHPEDYR